MHLSLILNRNAGSLRSLGDPERAGEEVAEIFRQHGHSVSLQTLPGADALGAIERTCAKNEVEALVVGGGDGTISAAAAAAAKSGTVLGVLPLGTMNLFARSLGIPLEMKAAAEALATGAVSPVDIGDVNGRFFVHHVTLGLHAEMIATRKRRLTYRSRLGKIWASCQAWWFVVRQPPRLHVRIRADGLKLKRRTAGVLVSNNPLGDGHLPFADDPRQGTLGLYVVKSRRPLDLVRLILGIGLGRISDNPQLDQCLVGEVEIRLRESPISASVDGEIVSLATPIRCYVHRGGLRVLRPRDAAAGGTGAMAEELPRGPGVGRTKQA
jgi:diacylglycerol kinase family enzyme